MRPSPPRDSRSGSVTRWPWTPSTCTCRRGRSTASSAPTGPARPPRSGCCSAWSARPSGEVTLLGQPLPAGLVDVLPRVGALVEGPAFHPYLSGRDNLARLDSVDRTTDPRTARTRVDGALDRVGLLAAATKRYRAYSLGMRQRLAIASTLLRPRDLLVLDEPTNGLDPQGTREVRSLVGSLADGGHHGADLQPPALGGRADVLPRRGDARRPAARAGHQRRGPRRHRDPGDRRDGPAPGGGPDPAGARPA